MTDIGMREIRDFFGMNSTEMLKEWKGLTETDKAQIKQGIANGSFTY